MILKPEEYSDFLEVHHSLLYYTGLKNNMLPAGTSLKEFSDFPVIVRATILPYYGEIIYDGFLQSYETYLGPNMTWEYNEIYKEAKSNGQIIISLNLTETK